MIECKCEKTDNYTDAEGAWFNILNKKCKVHYPKATALDTPKVRYQKKTTARKIGTNNTTGYIGVVKIKGMDKWKVGIKHKGKAIHLGYFVDIDEAVKTRKEAEKKYFRGLK